jgi:hypothetical protein
MLKVWQDVDAISICVNFQKVLKNSGVPLPADDEYALPRGSVTLDLCVHPEVSMPPACGGIRTNKVVTRADMICKQVERFVESVLIRVVRHLEKLAEAQPGMCLQLFGRNVFDGRLDSALCIGIMFRQILEQRLGIPSDRRRVCAYLLTSDLAERRQSIPICS